MKEGQLLGGRYRLGRQLGIGSFGRVYEGHHTSLTQRVAIKVFRADVVARAGGMNRFMADARAACRLHHLNIVQVLDIGKVDDTVYVVTELVLGRTLHDHISREGRLRWPQARAVALQITAALKAAHKRGVLHRALTAANCFVLEGHANAGEELRIKVSDFGSPIPSLAAGGRGEEDALPIVDNAAQAAPEPSRAEASSVRSDLHALGMLLHRMLTGVLPFEVSAWHEGHSAHDGRPGPSSRGETRSIPEVVEAMVLRALAEDPEEGFGSAREFELAIEAVPPSATSDLEQDAATPGAEHLSAPSRPAPDEAMHAAFERREELSTVAVAEPVLHGQGQTPYLEPVVHDVASADLFLQLGTAPGLFDEPVPPEPAPLPGASALLHSTLEPTLWLEDVPTGYAQLESLGDVVMPPTERLDFWLEPGSGSHDDPTMFLPAWDMQTAAPPEPAADASSTAAADHKQVPDSAPTADSVRAPFLQARPSAPTPSLSPVASSTSPLHLTGRALVVGLMVASLGTLIALGATCSPRGTARSGTTARTLNARPSQSSIAASTQDGTTSHGQR